ncbi:MAG: adenylate/guanylate cyclase domain-containing protein, partial [Candidatus Riflebacteria bacterium]
YEINNLLNQQVEEFNIAINAYRTGLETQHARLSESLNFMKEFEFVPFLKYWMKNRPITAIMTRINHNNGLIGRNSKIRIMPFESELKDFLFTCVENSFRRRKEDGRESDGSVGMFRFRIKGLGILISDLGMIHNSSFSNLSDLYSLIPVFPGNDRHAEVTSSFLIKYSSILMLQDFFRQQPDLLNVTEKAGFKIQKCYIPLSSHSELPERGDLISSPGFPYEQIIDKLEKIQNSRSQETWVNNRNGRIQVVHVEFSQNLNVLVALIAEQTGVDQHSILPPLTNMFLYLIGLLLINLVLMGRFFVAPLRLLQQSAEEVAEGHFSHQVSMESGDEFSELGHAFNQMIAGLDEKERMSSFVSENVLAETADENENVLLPGGERSQVSVLFCSLPELKKFLASSSPDIAISYLDRLIDRCDIISRQYNGVIDKIIEDTVMIVFRQQDAGNSHVIAACKTALEISSFFPNDECPLRLSAGISSGEAVSGKIGSLEGKLDYTVIGNPVNLAARLKAQAAAADQTGILLCPQTIRMLKGIGRLRFIERVEIKGRTRSFPMYELQGLRL